MRIDIYAPFDPGTTLSIERLGVQLLGAVQSEVSAYVLLDQDGKVIALKYFDTLDSASVLAAVPTSGRIVLFSGHPQLGHVLVPYDNDLRNLALLPDGTDLYLVHEHICVKA